MYRHRLRERNREETRMEKVLLSIITVSGLCAVSSHAEHHVYHFVYDLKNWTEAQSYCREKYTDLVTIDSMEEVTILNNLADKRQMNYKKYSNRAWIGLYDDLDKWKWSLSDSSFYEHGETEFRRWQSGQPNNRNGRQYCTWIQNGRWYDDRCEYLFEAVCSDVRGTDVKFFLTDTTMTWTEAQSFCREHYTDLASVRSEAENQKVQNVIPAGTTAWIGLFRDSLKWSDGRNSSFRYWGPNSYITSHTNACVAADFSNSGRWEDWTCDQKRAFICYSVKSVSKMQVMKVRFETKNSSLDLNDPAVMEAMLKQLKQKLKDQGVSDNISLSWKKQSDGKVFHKEEKKTKKKINEEL